MKKYLLILVLGLIFTACKNNNHNLPADVIYNPNSAEGVDESGGMPKLVFAKTEHDFGTVIQGEIVTYNFRFTNKGNADLVIAEVSTSCGCTVSNYPKEPIKPGETKFIEAKFNSEARMGFQHKRITVLTNAIPARTQLFILANVVKPGQ